MRDGIDRRPKDREKEVTLVALAEAVAEKPLVVKKLQRAVGIASERLGETMVTEALGHMSEADSLSKLVNACGLAH